MPLTAGKVVVYDAAAGAHSITNVPDQAPPGSSFPLYDASGVQKLISFRCPLSNVAVEPELIALAGGVATSGAADFGAGTVEVEA